MELDTGDRVFLERLIRRKRYFLVFSILSTVMGIGMLLYHLAGRDLNGVRFVLIVFILLLGRSNLRQYRVSAMLERLRLID
ncbi:membrane protein [Candidatus Magnetobacterium bavaricum]|uniref:Membrane protein n=1 Tax=Candidatus Magnetobacterium bavaricum TaxID=29290 RepID=A0A0F3GXI0_9BACT|nr:membrane protein [Candidatus Magnetobacterium bavaricum]